MRTEPIIGIRLKLLVPLLVMGSLFLLGFERIVWPQLATKQLEQHLVEERKKIEVLGTALIHPLRNDDLAQVYSILKGILERNPNWKDLVLKDIDGRHIYPLEETSTPASEKLVSLQHSIDFFGVSVATISVATDVSPIYEELERFSRLGGMLIFGLLLVAILISVLIQEKLIISPLSLLVVAARRMAAGDFDAQLPRTGNDEVGQLIRSFAGMRLEVKNYQEKLHNLAHHDTLTGLPNRMMFLDRLEHAIAQANRNNRALALLFLDLDQFKYINDDLGHAAGDALLVSVAERLSATVREGDTVARFGGDEFIVIIEGMENPGEAEIAAQRIVNAFHEPVQIVEQKIPIGISIGVTVYPRDATEISILIQNADHAMYLAKKISGSNYFLFEKNNSHH